MSKIYIKNDKTIYYIKYGFIIKTRCNRKVFKNDLAKTIFITECKGVELDLNLKINDIKFNNNFVYFVVESNLKYSPNEIAQKIKSRTSRVIRDKIKEFNKMPSLWTRELFVSTVDKMDENLINDFLRTSKKWGWEYDLF